ncbi:histidine-rich carboxyl terminus protein 1 [Silurus meridionalis]|uniref:GH18 domain-containing protein n=1 Tax=Silurus meridionalis TaxID=175797 RepID=A0A8T0AWK6_SILME|nr:histidine-rich carboxyl terminus protein 1 [Silurus meridionalis]KAF7696095.1 hypothetical protein HF521_006189 [Silurus meridionalis]
MLPILVFTCLTISAVSAAQHDSTVACYMDASLQHMFFHVDPFLCTHIIYSTAYIDTDFSLKTLHLDADTYNYMLKDRNPALKMLLGLEVTQSRLEVLSQEQISLDKFVNSTMNYVKKNSFDGVDLAWLENDTDGTQELRNTETLTFFLKKLRGWTDQADSKSLLVSVSLQHHGDPNNSYIDKKTLSQYVDIICLIPLSPNNDGPHIDKIFSYWQDQVDPKNLILALPAIIQQPRIRQDSSQSMIVGINPDMKAEQINGPGMIIAKQICQSIKSGQKELKTLTKLKNAQGLEKDLSWILQKGFGGVGVVMIDINNFLNSVCPNCTQNEKAIIELNVITGHHCKHGNHGHCHNGHEHHGHHRHHGHGHHRHGHNGHRHHRHGHHGHRHHGYGHYGHRHHRHHHGHGHHGHGNHSDSHHVNNHPV